jgi:hypothetical protein
MDEVRQIEVPDEARARSRLQRVDYADAFLAEVGLTRRRSAEAWARVVLEEAPLVIRQTLTSGWAALGLRLGGSSDTVLGWPIRRRTPGEILLGAGSRIGMPGELLFVRWGDALLFATFVQQDNPAARAMWAGAERVHIPTVRRLLEGAVRRTRTDQERAESRVTPAGAG